MLGVEVVHDLSCCKGKHVNMCSVTQGEEFQISKHFWEGDYAPSSLDKRQPSRPIKETAQATKSRSTLSDISITLLHICAHSAMLTLARIAWYERTVFRRLFTAPQLRTVQIDIMPK